MEFSDKRAEPADNDAPTPADETPSRDNSTIESTDAYDASDDRVTVPTLLQRMRDGNRAAAAEFVTLFGYRIRRRIRQKLNPAMRRLFDSHDILSTLGRRLDLFVRSRSVGAKSEAQLWALVYRIAENAVIDKARVFRRLEAVEKDDGPFAHDLLRRLRTAEERVTDGVEIELGAVMEFVQDPVDREILHLWLLGTRHTVIAEYVELAPTAVRKRWQEIKSRLYDRLAPGLEQR